MLFEVCTNFGHSPKPEFDSSYKRNKIKIINDYRLLVLGSNKHYIANTSYQLSQILQFSGQFFQFVFFNFWYYCSNQRKLEKSQVDIKKLYFCYIKYYENTKYTQWDIFRIHTFAINQNKNLLKNV